MDFFFKQIFQKDPKASYDLNSDDADPTPRYDFSNENKYVKKNLKKTKKFSKSTNKQQHSFKTWY